jgi:hypothetical protein
LRSARASPRRKQNVPAKSKSDGKLTERFDPELTALIDWLVSVTDRVRGLTSSNAAVILLLELGNEASKRFFDLVPDFSESPPDRIKAAELILQHAEMHFTSAASKAGLLSQSAGRAALVESRTGEFIRTYIALKRAMLRARRVRYREKGWAMVAGDWQAATEQHTKAHRALVLLVDATGEPPPTQPFSLLKRPIPIAEAARVANMRCDALADKLRRRNYPIEGPKRAYVAELSHICSTLGRKKRRIMEWADKEYPAPE